MQFTIGQLLLVFPAFFVSVFCAATWDNFGVTCRLYRHHSCQNEIRRLYFYVDEVIHSDVVTDELAAEAQVWLDGVSPKNSRFTQLLEHAPEKDAWGRPYRLAKLTKLKSEAEPSFGIYTTGEDGISNSNGNDLDDLNSWDNKGGAWYRNKIARSDRIRYATQGAFLTPIVFAGLVVFSQYRKRTTPP